MNKSLVITGNLSRKAACNYVMQAELGQVFNLADPKQSDVQREKYHAMIADVAKQNDRFDSEVWKRLLIDQFKSETNNDQFPKLRDYWRREQIKIMPSLDGQRVITLGEQSRKFPIYVSSAFIEWLYAWGAENEIVWSEPRQQVAA